MQTRPVILNVAGTVLSLLLGFVSSLLVARWLGSADRGLFALMQSAGEVAANVAGLGIPFAVVYFAARRGANQRAIFGNTLAYAGLLALVFIPVGWFFRDPIADLLARGAGDQAWVLAALIVPTSFLYWSTHNQLHAALRFGALNALLVFSKFASFVVIVVLVGVAGLGVSGALLAVVTGSLAAAVGTVLVLRGPIPALDTRLFCGLVHYGLRVQTGTIFQLLNYRLDVFILQAYRPLAAVGYYVVAQVVAELTTVISSAFQTSLMPLIARADDDETATTISSLHHHSLLAGAATLANAGFGSLVILYGYGAEFRPALVPMLILLPGIWFLGTGHVVAGDLRGRNRPGIVSAMAGIAVVVTVSLDIALIPPYGVTGAAIASVCAYTTYGVGSILALAQVTKLPARSLVLPTRADLKAYPAALRRLRARLTDRGIPSPTAQG